MLLAGKNLGLQLENVFGPKHLVPEAAFDPKAVFSKLKNYDLRIKRQ
jgi:hypothetical protein